ncbi:MAG: FHA domain-containing protein [Candidatus Nitrospinota bacterium M3_3B_026]
MPEREPAQILSLSVMGRGGEEKAFPLDRDSLTIGRESGCDIIIPDLSISKKHARVFIENGRTMIADGVDGKPSVNGVYVNDARISGPVALKEGDVVKMGVLKFMAKLSPDLKRQATLEQVTSAENLRAFLEYGEAMKAREADILARISSLDLGAGELTEIFDAALDRAMEESRLKKVGFISALKHKALKETKSGGGRKAGQWSEDAAGDPDATVLDPAFAASAGAGKRRGLLIVAAALLGAFIAAALVLMYL